MSRRMFGWGAASGLNWKVDMTLLKDKLASRKLILASRSPRRMELMAGAGLEFEVADCGTVEEVYPPDLPAAEVPEYLAALKSESYHRPLRQGDILITADTVVLCGGSVMGKPQCREEAVAMLEGLAARRHTVVTGVAIRDRERMSRFASSTEVWFRPLSAEEIEFYVDNFKPYDKAGAYGVQEWIGYVAVERIEGSFYNVMGLPIQRLYTELDAFIGEE